MGLTPEAVLARVAMLLPDVTRLPLADMRGQAVVTTLAATNDESLPQVKQKVATKLQVAMGPRWVG